jgi:hypothetical protein
LTFGAGVELVDTYPKQLETLLNGRGDRRHYEVINAGVPAYDTWQEAAYLRDHGVAFAPSLVILGFYANDIVPVPTAVRAAPGRRPEPEETEEFRTRSDAANRVAYLLKQSRVLLLARQRFSLLVNRLWPSSAVVHERSLLRGDFDEHVEAGFREVDRAFEQLGRLGREGRFDLLVVVFPMAEQIAADYPHAAYPSRVLELARSHGLPVIDLMPDFEKAFTGFGSLFIEWDGHPNARAYGIAARRIHEFVVARGGIDVARTGAVSR